MMMMMMLMMMLLMMMMMLLRSSLAPCTWGSKTEPGHPPLSVVVACVCRAEGQDLSDRSWARACWG
eukprot:12430073-Karenia_brevis.AAC.1